MPGYKYSEVNVLPETVNFSEIEEEAKKNGFDFTSFEVSDMGQQMEDIQDDLQYEKLTIQILANLDQREKIVFMFQLLRDFGFAIDHKSCAKTLEINRQGYMKLLSIVRKKASLIVYQSKNNTNRVI